MSTQEVLRQQTRNAVTEVLRLQTKIGVLETRLKQVEPDWSNSETLLTEAWKNPFIPVDQRFLIADGAIAWRNRVIANLRERLAKYESTTQNPHT